MTLIEKNDQIIERVYFYLKIMTHKIINDPEHFRKTETCQKGVTPFVSNFNLSIKIVQVHFIYITIRFSAFLTGNSEVRSPKVNPFYVMKKNYHHFDNRMNFLRLILSYDGYQNPNTDEN